MFAVIASPGVSSRRGSRGLGCFAVVNVPNAYRDARFNQAVDRSSGYRTNSILCVPMKDQFGKVIAAVQVINKLPQRLIGRPAQIDEYIHAKEGEKLPFSEADVRLAVVFAGLAGLSIERHYLQAQGSWNIFGD